MKRKLVIVIINILIFVPLLLFLDRYIKNIDYGWHPKVSVSVFKKFSKAYKNVDISDCPIESLPEDFYYLTCDNIDCSLFYEERVLFGEEYIGKKNPIIILGCSYAYGHGLYKEDTFPYILSELTQRPVFNFSRCAGDAFKSIDNLYQYISADSERKNLIASAEYVIYVYMADHINRYLFNNPENEYNLRFLPSKFEKFLTKLYSVRFITGKIRYYIYSHDYPNTLGSEKLLKKFLINMNKHVKTFAPKSEFIIVLYDEKFCPETRSFDNSAIKYMTKMINSDVWNEFAEKYGAKVVHTKDLTGIYFDKEYKLDGDFAHSGWHPNRKAWDLLTPLLIKEYIKED